MKRIRHNSNHLFANTPVMNGCQHYTPAAADPDSDELTFSEGEPLALSEMETYLGYATSEYLNLFVPREADEPTRSPAKTPQRKRTYAQRKDEMDTLTKQIAFLETKLDFLKHRAGIPDQQSVAQQAINNTMLREILRNKQYLVAGLKSNIATDMSEHVLSPISMTIRLGSDAAERRAQLLAMKAQQLHDSRRFMEKRAQFNRPTTRFSESTRFQNDQGDTFAVTFDIFPLRHATSVKQVYDAVLFHWFNMEICMSEVLGDVCVREEKDTGDESVSHHRLVTKRHGIAMETNNVLFSEYKQHSSYTQNLNDVEEAIFVGDFVNEDDLYPYRPKERVREDVTSIITIKAFAKGTTGQQAGSDTNGSEAIGSNGTSNADPKATVVVLTRWVQSRLHKSEFEIPEAQLVEFSEDSGRASAALLNAVCTTI